MTEQHQSWRAATNPRAAADPTPRRSSAAARRGLPSTSIWTAESRARRNCGTSTVVSGHAADRRIRGRVSPDPGRGWRRGRRGGDDRRDPRPGRGLHRERPPVADATRHDRLVRGAREVLIAGVLSGHTNRRKRSVPRLEAEARQTLPGLGDFWRERGSASARVRARSRTAPSPPHGGRPLRRPCRARGNRRVVVGLAQRAEVRDRVFLAAEVDEKIGNPPANERVDWVERVPAGRARWPSRSADRAASRSP